MKMVFNSNWLILLAILIILLGGCATHKVMAPALQRFYYVELHMGSLFRIVMYAPDRKTADKAAEAAFRRIIELDNIMSDYYTNSELVKLCKIKAGTPVKVSNELFDVISKSLEISKMTDGAFDITIGPCVKLWRLARTKRELPSVDEVNKAKSLVDYKKIRLSRYTRSITLSTNGMILDLGGIGKGYSADQALKLLRSMGITRALVAASGDIAMGDPPPGEKGWLIGVESIDQQENGIKRYLKLSNCGISTSGDTEQYVIIGGKRYSHIVDPKTCLGLTNRIGVTVIAPDATTSDSLATALCSAGLAKATDIVKRFHNVSAFIVTIENERTNVIKTAGFPEFILE